MTEPPTAPPFTSIVDDLREQARDLFNDAASWRDTADHGGPFDPRILSNERRAAELEKQADDIEATAQQLATLQQDYTMLVDAANKSAAQLAEAERADLVRALEGLEQLLTHWDQKREALARETYPPGDSAGHFYRNGQRWSVGRCSDELRTTLAALRGRASQHEQEPT